MCRHFRIYFPATLIRITIGQRKARKGFSDGNDDRCDEKLLFYWTQAYSGKWIGRVATQITKVRGGTAYRSGRQHLLHGRLYRMIWYAGSADCTGISWGAFWSSPDCRDSIHGSVQRMEPKRKGRIRTNQRIGFRGCLSGGSLFQRLYAQEEPIYGWPERHMRLLSDRKRWRHGVHGEVRAAERTDNSESGRHGHLLLIDAAFSNQSEYRYSNHSKMTETVMFEWFLLSYGTYGIFLWEEKLWISEMRSKRLSSVRDFP